MGYRAAQEVASRAGTAPARHSQPARAVWALLRKRLRPTARGLQRQPPASLCPAAWACLARGLLPSLLLGQARSWAKLDPGRTKCALSASPRPGLTQATSLLAFSPPPQP